jgi:hypothetical protein
VIQPMGAIYRYAARADHLRVLQTALELPRARTIRSSPSTTVDAAPSRYGFACSCPFLAGGAQRRPPGPRLGLAPVAGIVELPLVPPVAIVATWPRNGTRMCPAKLSTGKRITRRGGRCGSRSRPIRRSVPARSGDQRHGRRAPCG